MRGAQGWLPAFGLPCTFPRTGNGSLRQVLSGEMERGQSSSLALLNVLSTQADCGLGTTGAPHPSSTPARPVSLPLGLATDPSGAKATSSSSEEGLNPSYGTPYNFRQAALFTAPVPAFPCRYRTQHLPRPSQSPWPPDPCFSHNRSYLFSSLVAPPLGHQSRPGVRRPTNALQPITKQHLPVAPPSKESRERVVC